MKVNRKKFQESLNGVRAGLTQFEMLEQSNSYIFQGDKIKTFNEEIFAEARNPLDFDAIVVAEDFNKVLAKFPDDELDISRRGADLRIKGKRREAGITCQEEVRLPIDEVPKPKKWTNLEDGVFKIIAQAAKACGKDHTQFLTTCVHITPNLIQASDNLRLFRATCKTGFPSEILLPASAIDSIAKLNPFKISMDAGWTHFRTKAKTRLSVRCYHEKYHKGVDTILKLKNARKITLPSNLREMLARADIMQDSKYDARVNIQLEDGWLTLTSRKDSGWYKEKKRIKYNDTPIIFMCHPSLLEDVLDRARKVLLDRNKIKIETDIIEFVVSLTIKSNE